jgi:SAM-dependent methyltransferase
MSAPPSAATNGLLWGARADDWAEIQEGQFRAGYEAVFDRVGLAQGERYCDVGCGAGLAAQLASARGAQIFGLDAAESLLAIARRRVPTGTFRHGEMEALPFADHAFDLVTGFNAFQYAANPVVALAEAGRVTRPGGKVVILTWGEPAGMEAAALVTGLKGLLPAPPAGAPGPFALSEERNLRDFVVRAGLVPQEVRDVGCVWSYPDLPTAVRGLGSSGVAARARANSSAAAVDQAHRAALAPYAQRHGSYRLQATLRWLVAQA